MKNIFVDASRGPAPIAEFFHSEEEATRQRWLGTCAEIPGPSYELNEEFVRGTIKPLGYSHDRGPALG